MSAGRSWRARILPLLLVGGGGLALLYVWNGQHRPEPVAVAPAPKPVTVTSTSGAVTQLALAATAAFGKAAGAAVAGKADPDIVRAYTPETLVPLGGDRFALISVGEKEGAAHVETGALGIHYLAAQGKGFRVIGSWPDAVEGNGFGGAPSSWKITRDFTGAPAIYSEAGYGNQGTFCTWAEVTELAPAGPTSSGMIRLGYSDEGAMEDAGKATNIEGIVTNFVANRSFDVRYSGTTDAVRHYVRQDGKWVAKGPPVITQCGEETGA
jgi:hypothetical protein